ncbi:Pollen Ole e 1 allergen/extensin [Macleaya cordata]|uniref:Pollen Ole e 1 allergen/extensin n=1 Tax=Macleaya cordata TaxID=56857 RepID=A0A200RBU2_MACCD|nr:Pollen Ole e 1 allergen/extensin [Macleaya cordata]
MIMSSFPVMLFLFIFLLLLLLFVHQHSVEAGRENPLLESVSSRTDMVQLAGYGEEKLSSVLVSGTVLCKACLDGETQLPAWPVTDASVGVTCKTSTGGKRRNQQQVSRAQGITDEYGDFMIDLPSHIHALPNLEKACTVRVIRLPKKSPCSHGRVFVRKPNKGIRLSSVGDSIRMYTAGSITLKQPSWRECARDTEEKTS